MNLSSFSIGAFLSHAAKAHGDMGGTKHLHYRRLSSAGLLLASSLLLAPTVAQDSIDFPFNTAIGTCDENVFTPAEFSDTESTLRDYCTGAVLGNAPSQTWITSNLPQSIPNLFEEMIEEANFDNDAGFTPEITIEIVSGSCSISGIQPPLANQRDLSTFALPLKMMLNQGLKPVRSSYHAHLSSPKRRRYAPTPHKIIFPTAFVVVVDLLTLIVIDKIAKDVIALEIKSVVILRVVLLKSVGLVKDVVILILCF